MRINKLHTICMMTLSAILFVSLEASAQFDMEAGAGCIDEACMFGGQTLAQNTGVAQLHKINIFSVDGKDPREAQDRAAAAVRALQPIAVIETKNDIVTEYGEAGKSSATAFLVSPCLALTNHHVVFGADKNPDRSADHSVTLHLGAGANGGFKYAVQGRPLTTGRSTKDGNDWTLLKLDKCAGRKLGWMDIEIASASKLNQMSVSMAGYPNDHSIAQLSFQKKCMVQPGNQKNASVYHDCASRAGSSGSPIFVMKNGKPTVVAMHYGANTNVDGVLKSFTTANANGALTLEFLNARPEILKLINADIDSFIGENPATAPVQSTAQSPTA